MGIRAHGVLRVEFGGTTTYFLLTLGFYGWAGTRLSLFASIRTGGWAGVNRVFWLGSKTNLFNKISLMLRSALVSFDTSPCTLAPSLWRAVVTWRGACAFSSHRKDRRACRLIDVTIRTEHISVARPYAEHHGDICSTENVVFFCCWWLLLCGEHLPYSCTRSSAWDLISGSLGVQASHQNLFLSLTSICTFFWNEDARSVRL